MQIFYSIYECRTKKNLTLRELSKVSGVSKSQINLIENGKTHPNVYTLCLIAAALKVSPYELFSVDMESG